MDTTIWLTSDSHFMHNKDFIYKPRGFSDIEEMNEVLIENWNKVVKPDDIVYHLGDVFLTTNIERGINILKLLNGKKYLAYGNHETDNKLRTFKEEGVFEDIQMGYRIKFKKTLFIATHYPTIVANGNENKTLNLYGHTHQKTNFYLDKSGIRTYMYHVGVDSHNNTPVNLEDIIFEIKNLGKE
jgi:calcineurin-like phosphoesterase family protein